MLITSVQQLIFGLNDYDAIVSWFIVNDEELLRTRTAQPTAKYHADPLSFSSTM